MGKKGSHNPGQPTKALSITERSRTQACKMSEDGLSRLLLGTEVVVWVWSSLGAPAMPLM